MSAPPRANQGSDPVHQLAQIYSEAANTEDYAKRYLQHLGNVLMRLDHAVIAQIIEAFHKAYLEGKVLYFIANGGSAAVASHWVNDLVAGAYREGEPGFRAFSLTDNGESVTALGNDSGYDYIFAMQLKVHLQPGDVVYAMSVSGNSENIIRAVDYAKERGATTIGVSGFDGGRLHGRCDINLNVPTTPDEYGPVEDVFAILDHVVTGYLTMKVGKKLHH